ncbi:MAG: FtsX-like permease family protein [bacterium]|nr:FtsX-like permease family protein [bacterium]
MLGSYIKFFLRNLKNNKVYSLINILGLSIGLFTCILMLLYVDDELKYDRFHANSDNIYRLVRHLHYSELSGSHATTFAPFAQGLLDSYPEIIKDVVRFYRYDSMVKVKDNDNIHEKKLYFVDPGVFRVFDFPLISGNGDLVLAEPLTMVITEDAAKRYFSGADPVGKTLRMNDEHDFRITGVIGELPGNTHFEIDFLLSFESLKTVLGYDISVKNYSSVWHPALYTYLHISDNNRVDEITESLPDFSVKMYGGWAREQVIFELQPLRNIHLRSHLREEISANSDMAYVYIISGIALLVLVIACINFMNLSTSRSASRAKEVGVRKVLGAQKKQLIKQFIFESTGYSLISLVVAASFVEMFLPVFSKFTGKDLSLELFTNIEMLSGFILLILLVGIFAGSYPAFYMSAFKPVKVFRGTNFFRTSGSLFRKLLISLQFAITVILIIGTLIIRAQVDFIRNIRLGLNKDQVLLVNINDSSIHNKYELFRNELSQNNNIVSVSFSTELPFIDNPIEYVYRTAQTPAADYPTFFMYGVDYDFIKAMNIEIIEGRDFKKEISTDLKSGYILNETAAKKLGWENAVGKEFGRDPLTYGHLGVKGLGKVIGVVKDFHYTSLHNKIDPLAMFIDLHAYLPYRYVIVKTKAQNISETIEFIEKKWSNLAPYLPLEYSFLDDGFRRLYRSEEKLGNTFGYFTLLAIIVACMGLFGLISYTVEQRSKEIGVRKVLGAKVTNVVTLLSKEFLLLVVISNAIAWPSAFFAANKWLEQFAYKTEIKVTVFLVSSLVAVLISLITVSVQTIRAANADPVNSLRNE